MDKLLGKKTKQFVENKIRSGGTLDVSNITNNDNVYLCVHSLPTHPSINLDTAKTTHPSINLDTGKIIMIPREHITKQSGI
jgi:hypothetical protein